MPPCPTNQEFNRTLKELGSRIPELDNPFEKQITRDRKVQRQVLRKWELLMTHTARRSFCTNAFLRGIPIMSIMSVSGHRSEKSFRMYIKASGEEHAQIVKDGWKEGEK